ncbi:MAG: helix-turn-helix transcriptional regulator [Pirellulales bacterium]|nr:helix-turn-helix transcriptional regulator [Pirellulales bacterium]
MSKSHPTLSDQLRTVIDNSGLSHYRICKLTGITQPSMSRFMNGIGGLSLENLDKLAQILQIVITTKTIGSK